MPHRFRLSAVANFIQWIYSRVGLVQFLLGVPSAVRLWTQVVILFYTSVAKRRTIYRLRRQSEHWAYGTSRSWY